MFRPLAHQPRPRGVVGVVPVLQRTAQETDEYRRLAQNVSQTELANLTQYLSENLGVPASNVQRRFRRTTPPDAQIWSLLDHPDPTLNMMDRLRADIQQAQRQAQVQAHPIQSALPEPLLERLGGSVGIFEEALLRAFPAGLNRERAVPVFDSGPYRDHKLDVAPWAQVVQTISQGDERALLERYIPYAYNDFVDWVIEAFVQYINSGRVMARVASHQERGYVIGVLIGLLAENLQKSYLTVLQNWAARDRHPEQEPIEFALEVRSLLAASMPGVKSKLESEYLFKIHGTNLPHGVRYFVRQWYTWTQDNPGRIKAPPETMNAWAQEASDLVHARSGKTERTHASSSPEAIKKHALDYIKFFVELESQEPQARLEKLPAPQPRVPVDIQIGETRIPPAAVASLTSYLAAQETQYYEAKGTANERLFTLWFQYCVVDEVSPAEFARMFPKLKLITYDRGVPRLYSHKVRRTVAPTLAAWVADWVSWFTQGEWALSDRQVACVEYLMRTGALDKLPPDLSYCGAPAPERPSPVLPGPQAPVQRPQAPVQQTPGAAFTPRLVR